MKRVLSLLAFIILFSSCDDGNLVQEDIDFANVQTKVCTANNIVYKLKEQEALLLEIPTSTFVNEPTGDTPIIINIGTTSNRVVYNFYNGTVSTDNICETIPPATPYITDQWIATGGTIQIVTTTQKKTNADNSTRITGYNHNIVLKEVTFAKKNGTQRYETFVFGDYVTPFSLNFQFDNTLDKCSDSNMIYNIKGSESLTLDIDPDLILNEATPLNSPRTGIIEATKNILKYQSFTGLLTPDYFCATTTPETPAIDQEWNGVLGETGVSGIIEVSTTTDGPGRFKHTIVLKKVSLKKGGSDFSLGDNFLYGDVFTTE